MSPAFFERPILNSPYAYPARHWELDESGQPTDQIVERRRPAQYVSPIPQPKKRRAEQQELNLASASRLSTERQKYDPTPVINALRQAVDAWRALPNANDWAVTPETARLLAHWRHHKFTDLRPFFCQIEAVETIIWLVEVAPKLGAAGRRFLDHLGAANEDANPGLARLALKLATGAGKTTVMAMLIAWQTINAVRRPGSQRFTRGFLVVTSGLTIRDRLRELQPNDPDSYYASGELLDLSKENRALLPDPTQAAAFAMLPFEV
jgi:type III restriction enzyme